MRLQLTALGNRPDRATGNRASSLTATTGASTRDKTTSRWWHPPLALLLAASLGWTDSPAQQSPDVRDFRTGDGSRFVLMPIAGPPVVAWAIASPVGPEVDPPAAPGLAAACMLASMQGTWVTGSLDPTEERAALVALDEAQQALAQAPRIDGKPPAELVTNLEKAVMDAAALCDEKAFRRVLMGAPAQNPRIMLQPNCAVLTLTTVPSAIGDVAKLLSERREQQALRGFHTYLESLNSSGAEHWDHELLAPLYAEVLALAFPGSPIARSGDRPFTSPEVTRKLAETTWANSQAPSQTVQVLVGNFDAALAEQQLRTVFQQTSMPSPNLLPQAEIRGGNSMRRAVLAGAQSPAAVIAWPMHDSDDPVALQCLAQWLAGGQDSWLARELRRTGRKNIHLAARAGWPTSARNGMLVIEAVDTKGNSRALANEILAICENAGDQRPRTESLQAAYGNVLADWQQDTDSPEALARRYAIRLLEEPRLKIPLQPPEIVDFNDLPNTLRAVMARQPIVVEWSDS